jgi:predicted XRE-type DNA-binding protein
MEVQTFASVWDAISDTPAEAANMKARSELMIALQDTIEAWALTQAASAKRLGVSQPRLNDLLKGRIARFSLDALVDLATRAGLEVEVSVRPRAA